MSETTAGGPYLCAAVFCEKVLKETDGVQTLVRVIDRFTFKGDQENMPESTVELTAFVLLKAGDWRGGTELSLEPEAPSGHKYPKLSFHPNFEGDDDRGISLTVSSRFTFKEAGLYWFHVSLNQQLITRMPLRAVYERIPVSSSTGTENNPDK